MPLGAINTYRAVGESRASAVRKNEDNTPRLFAVHDERSGRRAAGDCVKNNRSRMGLTDGRGEPHPSRVEEKPLFSSQVAHYRTRKGKQDTFANYLAFRKGG